MVVILAMLVVILVVLVMLVVIMVQCPVGMEVQLRGQGGAQGSVQTEVLDHVSKEGKRVLHDYQVRYPLGPPGILLKVLAPGGPSFWTPFLSGAPKRALPAVEAWEMLAFLHVVFFRTLSARAIATCMI